MAHKILTGCLYAVALAGIVFMLWGLSGCAEVYQSQDQVACVGYGFRPGTEAFATCMMMADQVRQEHSLHFVTFSTR